ncbi:MAG: GAF domain-containing sensor histidine kinase [Candidatus Dormiibacterota bacterium]
MASEARRAGALGPSLAWTGWALVLLLCAAWLGLLGAGADPVGLGRTPEEVFSNVVWYVVLISAAVPAYATVGAIVAARQPRNGIGWLCLGVAAVIVLHTLPWAWASYAAQRHEAYVPAAWFAGVVGELMFPLPITCLVLLFPSGRIRGPWRWVLWAALAGTFAAAAGIGIGATTALGSTGQIPNPLWVRAVPDAFVGGLVNLGRALGVAALVLAAARLVFRLRRAQGDVRLQIAWFAYCGGVAAAALCLALVAALLGLTWPAIVMVTVALAMLCLGLPLAILVALLRHRLFGIEVLVNRTLVFAALSASVAAVYGAVVVVAGALLPAQSRYAAIAATALAAILLLPLRSRLQAVVNRLMYGDRDDPYSMLARLGEHLEGSGVSSLEGAVRGIGQGLKLSYVAITLAGIDRDLPAAVYGVETGNAVGFPLVHRGETLGELHVNRRGRGDPLSGGERRLLLRLAPQVAVAAHAFLLTAELRQSRERLIAAREEERRRLRRDLHDGLGPTLAGITLGVAAARKLMRDRPQAADRMLEMLSADARRAVDEVRQLVRDLRPPALDELGLLGAIQEQGRRLSEPGGLQVSVLGPADLQELPAAVEVAAYRITMEALTNVSRHAGARNCSVQISLNGALDLDVIDDGIGLAADRHPGVGLGSMEERATELGGLCVVEALPAGGTRVSARLPVI